MPERPYFIDRIRAITRTRTEDFYMFSVRREDELKPHLILTEDESFVDVGANVGYYTLKIAKNYENQSSNSYCNGGSTRKFQGTR